MSALEKDQGLPGVVKYLKVCSIALQQSISGHVVKDLSDVGPRISRTNTGIPRIIPAGARKRIRSGCVLTIQIYLSFFSMYREIVIPGKLKLKTITKKGSYSLQHIKWFKTYVPLFCRLFFKDVTWNISQVKPVVINKSAPQSHSGQTSTHPLTVLKNLMVLQYHYPQLYEDILKFSELTGRKEEFIKVIIQASEIGHVQHMASEERLMFFNQLQDDLTYIYGKSGKPEISRLGIKPEPAGKVRVYAMVDSFTQWVMRPLHKYLFSALALHKVDGTHDQLAPLLKAKFSSVEGCYSFDLSAATDRLPIILQRMILAFLFGEDFADLWKRILVNRPYTLNIDSKRAKTLGLPVYFKDLTYAVGQPMGALSSWAMLAVTHHFMVNLSYWLTGGSKSKLFTEYAVLGDDICIWNRSVALQYLKVCKSLGVEVNLSKSILSRSGTGIEFAKRTFYKGVDVSPLSFRELSTSLMNGSAMKTFQSKWKIPSETLWRILGHGYKSSLSSRSRALFEILLQVPSSAQDLWMLLFYRYPFKIGMVLDETHPELLSYVGLRTPQGFDRSLTRFDKIKTATPLVREDDTDIKALEIKYLTILLKEGERVYSNTKTRIEVLEPLFQKLLFEEHGNGAGTAISAIHSSVYQAVTHESREELKLLLKDLAFSLKRIRSWLSLLCKTNRLDGYQGKYYLEGEPFLYQNNTVWSLPMRSEVWHWGSSVYKNVSPPNAVLGTPEFPFAHHEGVVLYNILNAISASRYKDLLIPNSRKDDSPAKLEARRSLRLWLQWLKVIKGA